MKIDFSNVHACPICGSKRVTYNAMQPIEFACGSYVYQSQSGYHFKQNLYCKPDKGF